MEYVYAALVLHKLGKAVDEEGIKKLIEAAGATVDDAKLKSLVASLKDVEQAINVLEGFLKNPPTKFL